MQKFIAKFTYKKSAFTIVLAYLFLTGYAVSKLSNEKMENLGVFFIKPANNATVNQEVKIVMGLKGMNIRPAGDMTEKTGHHHLLIDEPPLLVVLRFRNRLSTYILVREKEKLL